MGTRPGTLEVTEISLNSDIESQPHEHLSSMNNQMSAPHVNKTYPIHRNKRQSPNNERKHYLTFWEDHPAVLSEISIQALSNGVHCDVFAFVFVVFTGNILTCFFVKYSLVATMFIEMVMGLFRTCLA